MRTNHTANKLCHRPRLTIWVHDNGSRVLSPPDYSREQNCTLIKSTKAHPLTSRSRTATNYSCPETLANSKRVEFSKLHSENYSFFFSFFQQIILRCSNCFIDKPCVRIELNPSMHSFLIWNKHNKMFSQPKVGIAVLVK